MRRIYVQKGMVCPLPLLHTTVTVDCYSHQYATVGRQRLRNVLFTDKLKINLDFL